MNEIRQIYFAECRRKVKRRLLQTVAAFALLGLSAVLQNFLKTEKKTCTEQEKVIL